MSRNPFGKNLSDIRFENIQSLKDHKKAEDEVLEYKEKIPGRLNLQKEVLGFANNIGGYLVIGVKAEKPENILERIVGVPKEANMAERIVSTVRDNSTPPFIPHPHLVEMPSDSTRCVIVIHAPESDTVHKASNGKYYFRTANETVPISPEFVAKIIGKEKIGEELKKIIDKLDQRIRSRFLGRNIGHHGWFGIICCPIPPKSFRMPIFSDNKWYEKIASNTLRRHLFSARVNTDHLSVYGPGDERDDIKEIIEFSEDGPICFGTILHRSGRDRPTIYESGISAYLDGFLKLLIEAYKKASFDGVLLIIASFYNIIGWRWATKNSRWVRSYVDDYMSDALPSDTFDFEIRYETTVSAVDSSVEKSKEAILAKIKRHFNILV